MVIPFSRLTTRFASQDLTEPRLAVIRLRLPLELL